MMQLGRAGPAAEQGTQQGGACSRTVQGRAYNRAGHTAGQSRACNGAVHAAVIQHDCM